MVWTRRSVEGGTEVEEQVELTAPRIIARLSTQQSRHAHERMFATLQRLVVERSREEP